MTVWWWSRPKNTSGFVAETGVLSVEELSEADVALIAKGEMAPEHAHLDEELGDWQA